MCITIFSLTFPTDIDSQTEHRRFKFFWSGSGYQLSADFKHPGGKHYTEERMTARGLFIKKKIYK
jgi:hypothetical protein